MLQSNQPYQRVDDGIGAGLIAGGLIGGAGAYAGNAIASTKGMKNIYGSVAGAANSHKTRVESGQYGTNNGFKDSFKTTMNAGNALSNESIEALGDGKAGKAAKFMYGSGKRRMAAAGGSILAGSVLGAGIDSANN